MSVEAAEPSASIPQTVDEEFPGIFVSPEAVEQAKEPDKPLTPDPEPSETDRIEPLPTGPVTLASGQQIEITPMDLRETMKLLKIITHGAGPFLSQQFATLDFTNPEAFGQALLALIIMSIGDAEDELIDFMQAMCQPLGFKDMKPEQQQSSYRQMLLSLNNPSLDESLDILTRIVAAESENLRSLGKRIGLLLPAITARISSN